MFECNRVKPVSTALSAKLTNLLAQWIATSCRPISVVEDDGLDLVLQAAAGDPSHKLPARRTAEKAAKDEKMVEAMCVALTGDIHWTSVNNDDYLGQGCQLSQPQMQDTLFQVCARTRPYHKPNHFKVLKDKPFLYLAWMVHSNND